MKEYEKDILTTSARQVGDVISINPDLGDTEPAVETIRSVANFGFAISRATIPWLGAAGTD